MKSAHIEAATGISGVQRGSAIPQGRNEYVIGLAAGYLFLVHAANGLLLSETR